LDILVNNAGINIRKPPHELALTEWRLVLETNLTSAFLASHAAYPHMRDGGGGKIVNIGSLMSIFGASFAPAYAASKGGIVQFSKVCASAWAKETSRSMRCCWADRHRARAGRWRSN
jgi:2-deoxy-D-gluconate 3-dehydrogenase